MKKMLSLALCLCMALAVLPATAVAAGQTEAEQVVRAVGIMVGDEKGNMNLQQNVTRAQFAKMLSVAAGQDQGQTGYSPFRDVKYAHWAAGYIKTASDSGWFLGYSDGTFRPENTILYEEGATAVLRMLGYTPEDYPGAYPAAQIIKFESLDLGEGVLARRGDMLTRQDCLTIFYNVLNAKNKQGLTHAQTLGYALNASGKIDYQALLLSEAKGPYVADDARWMAALPFNAATATVYLNGKLSAALTPAAYDVYYYNEGGAVLWVYTDKAVGIYQGAMPAQSSPEQVTVAGATYTIGDADAARKLSTMGEFSYGDAVALLLGMDGKVADVLPAQLVDGLRYGIITKAAMETYTVGSGTRTDYIVSVAATDGNTYSFVCDNTYLTVGALVSAGYENGKPVVTRLSGRGLTGKVSAAADKIGTTSLSQGACILEVTEDGQYRTLYPSRLAGSTLKSGDVKFYATDASGAISHLILMDATGDMHSYGILTASIETETEVPEYVTGTDPITGQEAQVVQGSRTVYSGEYQYIQNGVSGSFKLNDGHLRLGGVTGPARFQTDETGLDSIELLGKVAIASVGATSVRGEDGQGYGIADAVQVYIYKSGAYYLSQLSSVNGGDYELTGYVDSGFSAGRLVRVIIARQ